MEAEIKPYNTEYVAFWKVINAESNEIIDDGFESSADAEMYCFDNEINLKYQTP